MFNHGKFNLKRFNLPGQETTDIIIRDQFASDFEAITDIGQDIHIVETQNAALSARIVAASLLDGSMSGKEENGTAIIVLCDYIMEERETAALMASVSPSLNIYLRDTLREAVKGAPLLGEDITIEPEIIGIVRAAPLLGVSFTAPEVNFEGTFYSIISTAIFDTYTVNIDVTIPVGGKLVIDSDNYTVLLNGENVIDKHSGDWALLSRAVDRMTVTPSGSGITVNMLYTERYL